MNFASRNKFHLITLLDLPLYLLCLIDSFCFAFAPYWQGYREQINRKIDPLGCQWTKCGRDPVPSYHILYRDCHMLFLYQH